MRRTTLQILRVWTVQRPLRREARRWQCPRPVRASLCPRRLSMRLALAELQSHDREIPEIFEMRHSHRGLLTSKMLLRLRQTLAVVVRCLRQERHVLHLITYSKSCNFCVTFQLLQEGVFLLSKASDSI